MRKIIIGLLLLLSVGATAQWQQTGSKVRYVNGLGIPTKDTAAGVSADSSQIVIRPADSALYIKYKRTWLRVGGGGGSIAGSGTLNRVAKFTSTSAIGNSSIYDNGTAVGINTLTPTTTLQVGDGTGNPEITASGLNYDVVLGTPAGSALGFTTIGNYVGVYSNSATKDLAFTHGNGRAITFGTGNQTRLTITASGNLLLNNSFAGADGMTISNSQNLSWTEGANNESYSNIFRQRNSAATIIGNGVKRSNTGDFASSFSTSTGRSAISVGGGEIYLFTNPASTVASGTNIVLSERMRITSGGNVGIGTASPEFRLDVRSTATGTAASFGISGLTINPRLRIDADEANNTVTLNPNYNGATSPALVFKTQEIERVRITADGNVGVGTTSPTSKFEVQDGYINSYHNANANTAGYGIQFLTNGGGSKNTLAYIVLSQVGTARSGDLLFGTSNAGAPVERMRITAAGELIVFSTTTDNGAYNIQCNGTGVWGAGAYVNGSDSALKENILPIDSSLHYVKLLKPVTYKYKKFYSSDSTVQTGFIAQDLMQLFKGKPLLDGLVKQGGKYLSVAYQNLIPLLTKAIQEQQTKIESLEGRLAAIEAILKSNKIQ